MNDVERLTQLLARLPGLGPRSARRAVLHLLKKRETLMQPLGQALEAVAETVKTCPTCGNLDTDTPCTICRDIERDPATICVLEEVGDPATGLAIGGTTDNLKAAIAGETHEYTDMYPGMAKSARDEGFDEIADWFETLAKAEKSHAGRFQKALDSMD